MGEYCFFAYLSVTFLSQDTCCVEISKIKHKGVHEVSADKYGRQIWQQSPLLRIAYKQGGRDLGKEGVEGGGGGGKGEGEGEGGREERGG